MSALSVHASQEVEKTYIILVDIDSRPLLDDMGIDLNHCRLTGFAECLTAHQSRRHLITERVRDRINDKIDHRLCRQANTNVRSIRRFVSRG